MSKVTYFQWKPCVYESVCSQSIVDVYLQVFLKFSKNKKKYIQSTCDDTKLIHTYTDMNWLWHWETSRQFEVQYTKALGLLDDLLYHLPAMLLIFLFFNFWLRLAESFHLHVLDLHVVDRYR